MPAILFGSIGTIADTSEIQREAFNEAFAQHDLDWRWERDEYRALLTSNGGAQRIADYAARRGEDVDAVAVHAAKGEVFRRRLREAPLTARPGVADTVRDARSRGLQVGLVTSTSPANVEALLDGLDGLLTAADFDVVVTADDVEAGKPDPAAYDHALRVLGVTAADCVAVEDNAGGVAAATSAGIRCLAFPNANTAGHDMPGAQRTVEAVSLQDLRPAA